MFFRKVFFKNFLSALASAFIFYTLSEWYWKSIYKAQDNFKQLFIENPNPMWIYERNSLKIVDVNNSACNKYGYTKAEFLQLSLYDLRPPIEHQRLLEEANEYKTGFVFTTDWIHQDKNKKQFIVSVFAHDVLYNGEECRLVTSIDISERKQMELRLIEQNRKLGEIAWKNSHVVRRPVTNILALCTLIKEGNYESEAEKQQYLDSLYQATQELDQVIHEINHEAGKV